jgi:hypothetical protein
LVEGQSTEPTGRSVERANARDPLLPVKATLDQSYRPPEQTLVLLYTDRPAAVYWQPYLTDRDHHQQAEISRRGSGDENEALRKALVSVLLNIHWEWAKTRLASATGRAETLCLRRRAVRWPGRSGSSSADLVATVSPEDEIYPELARMFPAPVGDPATTSSVPRKFLIGSIA